MPAIKNAITSDATNAALDLEMVANFKGEFDRLAQVFGIFAPEVIAAGTALEQIKITGALADEATDEAGMSSGTKYVEGELVALSKYQVEKVPVGSIKPAPYRKQTTAQAILKSGYEAAVLGTDRKMLSNLRNATVKEFFDFLKNGTGEATGNGLQAALAMVSATLGDAMEKNGDSTSGIVHFVNRLDAAEYLGKAAITTQDVFGLRYLEDFLGIQNVFLTSQVAKGSVFATPVENIHAYALDFASLASAGLSYTTDESGLIGVAHTPAYDRVSAETHVLKGLTLFPEVKDYIVKGTVAPSA